MQKYPNMLWDVLKRCHVGTWKSPPVTVSFEGQLKHEGCHWQMKEHPETFTPVPTTIEVSLWVNNWNGPFHKTPTTTIIDLLRQSANLLHETGWSQVRSKPPESLTQSFWSQGAKLAKATNAKVGVSSLQWLSNIIQNKQTPQNPLVIHPSRFVIQEQGEKTQNRKGWWSLRCNDLSSRATVCPPVHFCRSLHRLPFPAPHIPRISLPESFVAIAPSWLPTNAR